MEQLAENAKELYLALKKSLRDGRNNPPDNTEMVNVIVKINEYDSKLVTDIQRTIGQLMLCFGDARTLVPDMRNMQERLIEWSGTLEEKQRKRQNAIWAIVRQMRSPPPQQMSSGGGGGVRGGGGADDVFVGGGGDSGGAGGGGNDLRDAMASLSVDDDLDESENITLKAEEVINEFSSIMVEGSGGDDQNVADHSVEKKELDLDGRWESLFGPSS